jgi:tetratricopeptide (TPR) repeat protein
MRRFMADSDDVKPAESGVLLSFEAGKEKRRKAQVLALEQRVKAFIYDCDEFDMAAARELQSIDPENPIAIVGRSLMNYLAGDYDEAVFYVNEAVHSSPLSKEAVLLKLYYIHKLADKGQFSFVEADAFVNHALHNFRDDADVLEHLIVIAAETFNSPRMARGFYDAGLALDKARFTVWDGYIRHLLDKPEPCADE